MLPRPSRTALVVPLLLSACATAEPQGNRRSSALPPAESVAVVPADALTPAADPAGGGQLVVPSPQPGVVTYVRMVVCLDRQGMVESASTISRSAGVDDPAPLERRVIDWKYRPYTKDNQPQRTCTFVDGGPVQGSSVPQVVSPARLDIDPFDERYRVALPFGTGANQTYTFDVLQNISATGDVWNVELVGAVPAEVRQQAIAKFAAWKYEPFKVDGKPYGVLIRFHYTLHPK